MKTRIGTSQPREFWDLPRHATPWLPEDKDHTLLHLAVEVLQANAELTNSIPGPARAAVTSLLRYVNSFYSNLIEGHGTYPGEIERAMRGSYATSDEARDLQLEARQHVEAERRLAFRLIDVHAAPLTTQEALLWLHEVLLHRLPEHLLEVRSSAGKVERVLPGLLRTGQVTIGSHEPPKADALPDFLAAFHQAYDLTRLKPADAVIAAAAAHHRLLWIHPFFDGNGRVARLFTQGLFTSAGACHGLWSLSRGFARHLKDYRVALAGADAQRAHDADGRGQLSDAGLHGFCAFVLRTALDQIGFMQRLLGTHRTDGFLARLVAVAARGEENGTLPPRTGAVLREAIFRDVIPRGEVLGLFGSAERTASKHLSTLIHAGLLVPTGDTHRSPLRFAIPTTFGAQLFPDLYPTGVPEAGEAEAMPTFLSHLRQLRPDELVEAVEVVVGEAVATLDSDEVISGLISETNAAGYHVDEVIIDGSSIDLSDDEEAHLSFQFSMPGEHDPDSDRPWSGDAIHGWATATIDAGGKVTVTVTNASTNHGHDDRPDEDDVQARSHTTEGSPAPGPDGWDSETGPF